MKFILTLIAPLLVAGQLFCQCGAGLSLTLQTQTEVDNFIADYCTQFEGSLLIQDDNNGVDNITSLEPLSSLIAVHGVFNILFNDQLTTLSGLEFLYHVGALYISGNSSLTNLDDLSSLYSTIGDVVIVSNENLQNINGLSQLTYIYSSGGTIGIIHNAALTNLDGFSSLSSSIHSIRIFNNENLINIDGLENISFTIDIDPPSTYDIEIYDNPQLSSCAIESVCNALQIEGTTSNIHDNGLTCNSREAVLEACVTLSNKRLVKPELKIYPTLVSNILHIVSPKKSWASIYNSFGVHVKSVEIKEGMNEFNVSDLKSGIYFIQDEFGFTQKIIKVGN